MERGSIEVIDLKQQVLRSRKNSNVISTLFECQICLKEFKETSNLFITQCEHRLNYCESCLHEYTIYMVSQFQEVPCPDMECGELIDTKGKFFKELPIKIQESYLQLHNFYSTVNDPLCKMCPKQNCNGIIRKTEEIFLHWTCETCSEQFCDKCLMKVHKGDCDDFEADVLINNLNYKRCKKCRMVV